MPEPAVASGFPEIRVPAALTFAGLALGFLAGIALRGTSALDALLAVAEPAGSLWLRALQLTILPLVIGLVVLVSVIAVGCGRWMSAVPLARVAATADWLVERFGEESASFAGVGADP